MNPGIQWEALFNDYGNGMVYRIFYFAEKNMLWVLRR